MDEGGSGIKWHHMISAVHSNEQRRRELSLQRQAQHRRDAQHQAPCLASFLNLHSDPNPNQHPNPNPKTHRSLGSFG